MAAAQSARQPGLVDQNQSEGGQQQGLVTSRGSERGSRAEHGVSSIFPNNFGDTGVSGSVEPPLSYCESEIEFFENHHQQPAHI